MIQGCVCSRPAYNAPPTQAVFQGLIQKLNLAELGCLASATLCNPPAGCRPRMRAYFGRRGRCLADTDLIMMRPDAAGSSGTAARFRACDMSALTAGRSRTPALSSRICRTRLPLPWSSFSGSGNCGPPCRKHSPTPRAWSAMEKMASDARSDGPNPITSSRQTFGIFVPEFVVALKKGVAWGTNGGIQLSRSGERINRNAASAVRVSARHW